MRHMSANRQWKVVDEHYSGNVFTDDHWYSTHIPRIVRVWTTQTTHKIRKPAQYCANFYAKPSFELLKTWNRVKHRYGEHRRTTAEVPRQKNWWNAQIADVSRKTRNCAWFMRLREFWAVWLGLQIIACHIYGAKPLPEPILTYIVNWTLRTNLMEFKSIYKTFHSWKDMWKCHLQNVSHFVQACKNHYLPSILSVVSSYNRPVAQIPQCTTAISHNAPFCNRNVHVCAHFCYKNGALWDICVMHCVICEMGLLCLGELGA